MRSGVPASGASFFATWSPSCGVPAAAEVVAVAPVVSSDPVVVKD